MTETKYPISIGDKFGSFVICNKSSGRGWDAVCVCGRKRENVRADGLHLGTIVSCGCKKTKHGNRRRSGQTVEYSTWSGMINRVKSDNEPGYKDRGITVCERWRKFENFLADMGKRPDGHSIDRIDNDKGYSPDNCRWATPTQQSRNTRRNKIIEYNGESGPLVYFSEKYGINYSALRMRIKRGWSISDAIEKPINSVWVKV